LTLENSLSSSLNREIEIIGTMTEAKEDNFRVIIVGGSVAGLTLAHCLRKNKIDFTILEANEEIAPQVGASIGILPNGARILDQLGLFDDVLAAVEPLRHSSFWRDSGSQITSSDTPKIIAERYATLRSTAEF
jgi:2-polyprenyl-6-methoxyphenol hydroxylase-like FAD-dependent oxidoreductase